MCLRCRLELVEQRFYALMVDVCPTCKGIWFDEDELVLLRRTGEDSVMELDHRYQNAEPVPPTPSLMLCPRCSTKMFMYHYNMNEKIPLESCDRCGGVWVDDGELTAMVEASRSAPITEKDFAIAEFVGAHNKEMLKSASINRFAAMMKITVRKYI